MTPDSKMPTQSRYIGSMIVLGFVVIFCIFEFRSYQIAHLLEHSKFTTSITNIDSKLLQLINLVKNDNNSHTDEIATILEGGEQRILKTPTESPKKSALLMLTSEAVIPAPLRKPKFTGIKQNDSSREFPSKTVVLDKIVKNTLQNRTHRVEPVRTTLLSSDNPVNNQKLELPVGPFYYMYELEEEFWWRWPQPGSDCSENGYVGHEHALLSGLGPPILPDNGLFLTWHFSLFSSLFNRLKRSSRRTMDPEQASLFVIPYDLGLDGYLDSKSCQNRRSCSRGLVSKLEIVLKKSKYFTRHNGADHVVPWSLGQYHPWPRNGCDVFMRDTCGSCAFTCYWMDPTKADNRFISVPFPSGYHWWDGIKNLPWTVKPLETRNLTAVYLGSTQTLNPAHTKIRRAMTAQCNASSECHWKQIGHNSKDNSIADFLSIYKSAVFCLCPPGDDPARKAVFDAILSGCIPVIFEVATLYNQYPWHLGEEAALDISVGIPGGLVRSGKIDFMSILLNIPKDVIIKKQRAIERLAPRLQYAMPTPASLVNRSDSTAWDPPFADGVDVLLDGLFERAARVLSNRSSNVPPKLMTGREWSQLYDVVKIKVPQLSSNGSFDKYEIWHSQEEQLNFGPTIQHREYVRHARNVSAVTKGRDSPGSGSGSGSGVTAPAGSAAVLDNNNNNSSSEILPSSLSSSSSSSSSSISSSRSQERDRDRDRGAGKGAGLRAHHKGDTAESDEGGAGKGTGTGAGTGNRHHKRSHTLRDTQQQQSPTDELSRGPRKKHKLTGGIAPGPNEEIMT